VQQQAARDRLAADHVPQPVSQVIGYLTGVMQAWPGPGTPSDDARCAVSGTQQMHQPHQQQQQQWNPGGQAAVPSGLQQQIQLQQQQYETNSKGPLICLSSSSSGSYIDAVSDSFWDAEDTGQLSSSSNIYDDALEDPQQVPEASTAAAADLFVGGSNTDAALLAAPPAAAAAASSNAALPGTPKAPSDTCTPTPRGAPSSSSSTAGGMSPFANMAAVAAAPSLFAEAALPWPQVEGGEAPGVHTQAHDTNVHVAVTTSAAGTAPVDKFGLPISSQMGPSGVPADAAVLGMHYNPTQPWTIHASDIIQQQQLQQQALAEVQPQSSLLASPSLAWALDRVQHVNPVLSMGPGGATAMLLNPARTAPQALFNPAAALIGVKTPEGEGPQQDQGALGTIIQKVADAIGSGSSSTSGSTKGRGSSRTSPAVSRHDSFSDSKGGTSDTVGSGGTAGVLGGEGQAPKPSPDVARGSKSQGSDQGSMGDVVRGAAGMVGLASSKHAAAGTMADTAGAADTSSSGSSSSSGRRAGRRLKGLLLPGHSRHGSSDGSVSGGSRRHGGGSSGSSADGGSGSSSDAVSQRRYLFSLDVRRLSLEPPLLPGSRVDDAALFQTHVHLPVLAEGEEEGA
jgi:hypothetical protein